MPQRFSQISFKIGRSVGLLRRKLVEGITIRFGSIDFFFKEGRQIGLVVNDLNNFPKFSKDENFLH